MDALEQCHSSNWARLLGHCNRQKNELNACLRKEVRVKPLILPLPTYVYVQRIERTDENRETAKERKLKSEQARKKFYDDE